MRHIIHRISVFFLIIGLGMILRLNAQNQALETTGDVLLIALPATALGTSMFIGDEEGSWQFTKGFLLNQAVTFGLKWGINKPRPNGEDNNAFPSGHTSTTFQSASFIQKRYGWPYGIPAYVIAGFTGYSRIETDKHDILDVLAGATIGIVSTYLFTSAYQREHMELTFHSDNNEFFFGFRYTF